MAIARPVIVPVRVTAPVLGIALACALLGPDLPWRGHLVADLEPRRTVPPAGARTPVTSERKSVHTTGRCLGRIGGDGIPPCVTAAGNSGTGLGVIGGDLPPGLP